MVSFPQLAKMSDAEKLDYCFGTREPRLAGYPHLIVPRSGWSSPGWFVDTILNVVMHTNAGVWGEALADTEGQDLAEVDDARLVEGFARWERPPNQWKLFVHVAQGRSTDRFTALVDTNAGVEILRKMAASRTNRDDMPAYIDNMADWIDDLGWVYFPLAYECPAAMFAVSKEKAAVIDGTERILRNCSITYARLLRQSGKWSLVMFSHPYKDEPAAPATPDQV